MNYLRILNTASITFMEYMVNESRLYQNRIKQDRNKRTAKKPEPQQINSGIQAHAVSV